MCAGVYMGGCVCDCVCMGVCVCDRERFWKKAGEWTGRVEISQEKIPGSKRSMYGYILTYSRL